MQREKYMQQAAIVTGASSGIGLAISRMLCEKAYEVFGFGRNFAGDFSHERFHPVVCDITDTKAACEQIRSIKSRYPVHILVNNAGVGYYGLHEELDAKKISAMVRTNLEAPMIFSNALLRTLKENRGWIINISSVTAEETNPHGCAYGATKAGLLSFSKSLFAEARKSGIKVVTIMPDMTATNLYRNADFKEDDDPAAHLCPEEIADAVAFVLEQRDGAVVTELTIRPQLHRIKRGL
jgi:short-subunit dehydrogenase